MLAVLDYGLGNIGSILNILKRIGVKDFRAVSDASELRTADKYILPGIGAFDTGISLLEKSGIRHELDRQVLGEGKPILGICLGMQMLGRGSEEGRLPGLNYLPFICKRFHTEREGLRVPHMGWDYVRIKKESKLVIDPVNEPRFYFVHSYYAVCEDENDILMECDYGGYFSAAVCRKNVYGVQFHPEKSHSYGKWMLKNFAEEV